ncbi:MAG TPA: hypothetical protein PKC14_01230 [Candidatus Absconditabacterales bacterium]|nr:hypothetical protein [Candidatus Absconditabacterales bacterium]
MQPSISYFTIPLTFFFLPLSYLIKKNKKKMKVKILLFALVFGLLGCIDSDPKITKKPEFVVEQKPVEELQKEIDALASIIILEFNDIQLEYSFSEALYWNKPVKDELQFPVANIIILYMPNRSVEVIKKPEGIIFKCDSLTLSSKNFRVLFYKTDSDYENFLASFSSGSQRAAVENSLRDSRIKNLISLEKALYNATVSKKISVLYENQIKSAIEKHFLDIAKKHKLPVKQFMW